MKMILPEKVNFIIRTLQEHGFEKGKLLGVILHDLLEYVMENPKENQEDILLDYAKKKYQL